VPRWTKVCALSPDAELIAVRKENIADPVAVVVTAGQTELRLALIIGAMCLPFGLMLTVLGAAKWLRNRSASKKQ